MRTLALGLLAITACVHGAPVLPDESPVGQRAAFQKAVIEFRANQRPGGAPDAPSLIREAHAMLEANGVANDFSGAPGDLKLTLQPSLETPLNRLALVVRDTVRGRAVYDLGRMLREPDAGALFDPATNTLFLPHAAITDLNADEPSVRHELVHLTTFGTLRTGWLSPYEGYLRSAALGGDELFLDELNAYAEDVRFAAAQLAEILRRDPDPAGRVARSDLAPVLQTRLAGEKPAGQLGFLEQVWDRLIARTLYGGSLSYPAVEALTPLQRAAQDAANVRYVQGPEGPMAEVSTLYTTAAGDKVQLKARFYLPSSTGLTDPKNPDLLAKQLSSALEAAIARADQFNRAKATFHAVLDAVSPAKRAELLQDAVRLAGDR